MFNLDDHFNEVFEIEMEGWCYGIEQYPGEIFPGLVHAIVKELSPSFKAAFEHGYVFDILVLAEKFSRAAKYLVHTKEITFSILAQFPNPNKLSEDAQFAMAQVIDQVEQEHGGALSRLTRKWEHENANVPGSAARRAA